jgi:hypothetical protein
MYNHITYTRLKMNSIMRNIQSLDVRDISLFLFLIQKQEFKWYVKLLRI